MRARLLWGPAVLCVFFVAIALARFAGAVPHDGGLDAAFDAADAAPDTDIGIEPEAEAPAIAESAQVPPAPSASAASSQKPSDTPRAIVEGSPVRLHDKRVFVIRAAPGGIAIEERARRASSALERAFEESESDDVHVDESQSG